VVVILLYAADGLSVWNHISSPSGRPRTGERNIWVPMFFQLAQSSEGMRTLQALATDGMKAWGCSDIALGCLNDAFRDLRFRTQVLSALENFADTARVRLTLPDVTAKPGWPSSHPELTVKPNPADPPNSPPPSDPIQRRRRGPTP
jgi:hypothetical protein